jgi:uncharacterized protein YggE
MDAVRLSARILVGMLVAGCASQAAVPSGERGIAVTGTGRVALRPDTGVVTIGVEARLAQLASATAEVDRAMRDVLQRVKALGVGDADIRTVRYAIEPVAEPRHPADVGSRIVGYRVSSLVRVRTRDVEAVGHIVDAAVAGGANVVGDIAFALADPGRAEAEARALAVKDAMARAGQIASAAGVRLGRLLSLTESPSVQPLARMSIARAPGPVEPGELEVTVTVQARYAVEP